MSARWVGPALLLLGVGLVVAAVATGSAHVALVLIVPVIFGSASPLLIAGILSIFLGILALGLTFGVQFEDPEELRPAPGGGPAPSGGTGGVVLVGPFPIFFGSWKNPSRRAMLLAVAVGTVVLVSLVLLALWLA
jgi:uncharacterized membrane protein